MPTPDAVQGGIRGGQITGGLSVGRNDLNISTPAPSQDVQPDPTFNALLKMGGQFFAEKVKELEQTKFVEGMAKAASGQALLEIVNERPAWAQVFGAGGAAEGARAYAAEAAVSQWASTVQEAMPRLRTESPDKVPQLLTEMGKAVLTGDQEADNAIQIAMLKQVPQLVKAHTREYVKWQQEEASAQQAKAFVAAGGVTDKIMRDPQANEQDRAAAVTNLLGTLSFAPGMNPDTWSANLSGFVKNAAQTNQFQMLNGLEQRGLLNALPPDDAAVLKSYVREQANRYKREAAPHGLIYEGNLIMAQMESAGPNGALLAPEVGLAKMQELNKRYRQESGNIVDLFDSSVLGASLQTSAKSVYSHRQAEAARVQRGRADAAEKGNKAQYELGRSKAGEAAAAVGQARHIEGTTSEQKDWVAGAWRASPGTPQGYFSLIENWRDGGIVADQVQLDMQRDWKSVRMADGPGTNFTLAYSKWRDFNFAKDAQGNMLPRHPAVEGAAAAYFGAEMDGAMRRFHDRTVQGTRVDDPAVSDVAFRAMQAPKPPAPDKALKADMTKTLRGVLGTDDAVAGKVLEQIMPYAQFYQGEGTDVAITQGLAAARAAGLEVWGGAVMQRKPGQEPLDKVTDIPTSEVGDVLEETVNARIKDERFKGGRVQSWDRLPGTGGRVQARVIDDDGELHLVVLHGDDLKTFWNKKMARDVDAGPWYQGGSQTTFKNPDGYPGNYATPEEWRAYRERQKQRK
jgi:hypothetical protein